MKLVKIFDLKFNHPHFNDHSKYENTVTEMFDNINDFLQSKYRLKINLIVDVDRLNDMSVKS